MLKVIRNLMEKRDSQQMEIAARSKESWDALVAELAAGKPVPDAQIERIVGQAQSTLEELAAAVERRARQAELRAKITQYDDLRSELRQLGLRERQNLEEHEREMEALRLRRDSIAAEQTAVRAKLQQIEEARKELATLGD